VKWVSSWLDTRPETVGFTNAITIQVPCDDPEAVTRAEEVLAHDRRSVIWFFPGIAYGAEGYELRADASACWARERDLIANYYDRSIAVWLADEPPDVAWSFWVDGGTRYDPNRYNGLLSAAASIVDADFPGLAIGYNFGSLPKGANAAAGATLIGLEAYGPDWQSKLQSLETRTPNYIWLMPPGFVQGDPAKDPEIAQRVRDEWAWAQHDQRVTGLYFFLWCCDDVTTGTKDFYTVSGGHLPLTLQALRDVAYSVRGVK